MKHTNQTILLELTVNLLKIDNTSEFYSEALSLSRLSTTLVIYIDCRIRFMTTSQVRPNSIKIANVDGENVCEGTPCIFLHVLPGLDNI